MGDKKLFDCWRESQRLMPSETLVKRTGSMKWNKIPKNFILY
ncbi:hypothetical protein N872_10970 [Neisseria meningitidis LNP27256]|nr:hypothetical protein N872_10970 [Neisseria meningitidis LNP27256]